MSRSVPEWIGKTDDSVPPDSVKLRVLESQGNKCACGCERVVSFERDKLAVDHKIPLKDGGKNRQSNLQVLLHEHHVPKTSLENSQRAEANRHKARAFIPPNKYQQPGKLSGDPIHFSRARGAWIDRRTGEVIEETPS